MNDVRLIAGKFRGRRLQFEPALGLRPTLDSVRETLFNWLMFKTVGARCLDAFSGTGALGFEALSRGAAMVVLIESQHPVAEGLKHNAERLKVADQVTLFEGSALDFLSKPPRPSMGCFDLIFLDPPFHQGLLEQALDAIHKNGWLHPEGFVYFEAEKSFDATCLLGWQIHRHKKMGDLQYGLLLNVRSAN